MLHNSKTTSRHLPLVDPADGGIAARPPILPETPGGDGVRLVSRDNPTRTARTLTRFLAAADIARGDTLLWNTVPWIVHAPGARDRPLRRGEIADGLTLLPGLLHALPNLRAIILAGRIAPLAHPVVTDTRPDVAVLTTPHPGPIRVCTSPAVALRIATALAETRMILHPPPCVAQ